MEEILDISKQLGILKFIENLPHGFQTQIGENGTALSGGQKQRIAIARALYRNPEILVLDEATSSIDSNSENYVQKIMMRLKKQGKTVLVISHRLSTLVNADTIFFLDQGKVIEQGSHQHLIINNGPYQKLWEKQLPNMVCMPKPCI